jgi:UDPglucose 6-dehydrogenase
MSHIVVVGSGVVGQATGKGFTKKGHSVSYVDINPQTIERLRAAGLRAMTSSEESLYSAAANMLSLRPGY